MIFPSKKEFVKKAKQGQMIPIYREILADLETPVTAFRKINRGKYGFLLESVEGGEKIGRYSFVGSDPLLTFQIKNNKIQINREGNLKTEKIGGKGEVLKNVY